MRGHREPEHTRRGMQRGRACRRAPAAVGFLRSLRVAVDRQTVDGTKPGAWHPSPRGARAETLSTSDVPGRLPPPSLPRRGRRLLRVEEETTDAEDAVLRPTQAGTSLRL